MINNLKHAISEFLLLVRDIDSSLKTIAQALMEQNCMNAGMPYDKAKSESYIDAKITANCYYDEQVVEDSIIRTATDKELGITHE